jgi:hypothetical protein
VNVPSGKHGLFWSIPSKQIYRLNLVLQPLSFQQSRFAGNRATLNRFGLLMVKIEG